MFPEGSKLPEEALNGRDDGAQEVKGFAGLGSFLDEGSEEFGAGLGVAMGAVGAGKVPDSLLPP
jgi:hypothetical protein